MYINARVRDCQPLSSTSSSRLQAAQLPKLHTIRIMATQILAGITVPDTPLIKAALALARKHLADWSYNHVIRSWLLGFAIADKLPDLADRDRELHSIAAILHDLGWDEKKSFISADKRFEVDGANAARQFIEKETTTAEWDKRRTQVLWDAIALHTTPTIAWHKEPEVKATNLGIAAELLGTDMIPGGLLSQAEWNAVAKAYPREGLRDGMIEKMCGFCKEKPATTFDNFVGDFGEALVSGYSRKPNRFFDAFMAKTF